jgi:glucose-6-phosphate isomerase
MSFLKYDSKSMMVAGISKDIKSLEPRLSDAKKAILGMSSSGKQGWLNLPYDSTMINRITKLASSKKRYKTCLVIGIGGSDLATRALAKALKLKGLVFAGANTDPDELSRIISELNWKTTFVNVVSKSGGTLEPITTFSVIFDLLKKNVGSGKVADRIVVTTDETSGALLKFAKKIGCEILPIPQNVGGRFSALSDVALFPIAWAGADISSILRGARRCRDSFITEKPLENDVVKFAALHYYAYIKQGRTIHVLMPYAESLREFAFWFRQLWAESLGKREDRNGKDVFIGPTPIASLGATDQHSQIQLYNEGPNDKVITFIEVEKFESKILVSKTISEFPELSYSSGALLEQLIHAERAATSAALTKNKRPNGTLFIKNVSPESLGSLIMFFEIATAICGELFCVNAYDQPGVEEGKKRIKEYL